MADLERDIKIKRILLNAIRGAKMKRGRDRDRQTEKEELARER